MNIILISTLLASAGGFIALSYRGFADMQGWPVGRLFKSSVFVGFGLLSIIGSVWGAIEAMSVLTGIGVFVGGFVIAFVSSFFLKSFAQWMAIMFLIVSFILQFFI